jgi:outer membrane receptor protein involved in Fe transport
LYSRLFNDPNYNINIDGIPSYDPNWEVKLQGIYNLPWGINSSWYYTYYTGETYTARARIGRSDNGDFNQGSVIIYVEPRGSRRLDPRHNLDLRFEKEFGISRGQLRFTADIFNAFNSGYVTDLETRFDLSNFERPVSLTGPRAIRLGVRYTF